MLVGVPAFQRADPKVMFHASGGGGWSKLRRWPIVGDATRPIPFSVFRPIKGEAMGRVVLQARRREISTDLLKAVAGAGAIPWRWGRRAAAKSSLLKGGRGWRGPAPMGTSMPGVGKIASITSGGGRPLEKCSPRKNRRIPREIRKTFRERADGDW